MKTNREKAIEWWKQTPNRLKHQFCDNYLFSMHLSKYARHHSSLSGREIEEIWRKETQAIPENALGCNPYEYDIDKPNQKQFKEFNPDQPFRRGIVELSGERCVVNYRFINDDNIEMYANDLSYIGETHYKSIVEEYILPKKNQKEFKQFDESLFKAYINKFSEEDKLKIWDYLTSELSNNVSKTRLVSWIDRLY